MLLSILFFTSLQKNALRLYICVIFSEFIFCRLFYINEIKLFKLIFFFCWGTLFYVLCLLCKDGKIIRLHTVQLDELISLLAYLIPFLWSSKLKWTLLCVEESGTEGHFVLVTASWLHWMNRNPIHAVALSALTLKQGTKVSSFLGHTPPPQAHSPAYTQFCTNLVTPTHRLLI